MKKILLITTAILGLTACSSTIDTTPTTRIPTGGSVNASTPSHIHANQASSVVNLTVEKPTVRDLSRIRNDALPDIPVGPFAASNMSIVDLMDAVSFESGIAFSSGDVAVRDKTITLVDPQKQPLSRAIPRIAKAANLFWSYEDEVLRFETERSFVVSAPAVSGVSEALASALENIGATNVKKDSSSGGIIFTADPTTHRKVVNLTDEWANNRNMIVYDTYIYEVSLSKDARSGLNLQDLTVAFDDVNATLNTTSAGNLGGGLALTIGGVGANVAMDVLAQSMDANGTYRSLSQPTLALVSGGKASFNVGNETKYVSDNTVSVNGDNTTTDFNVATLQTGMRMEISGELSNGIILTELNLRLASLVGFEEFAAGDSSVKLPSTSERVLSQTLMARPGDTLVMAGIMSNSNTDSASGSNVVPLFGNKSSESDRSELIIVMRPRIVAFK